MNTYAGAREKYMCVCTDVGIYISYPAASGRSVEKVQIFPTFERDFLKKYIVYARKNSFPIMSPKAELPLPEV